MAIGTRADGSIDLDSFAATSDTELQAWLDARLRGLDVIVPGGTSIDEDRYLAIAVAHDKLDTDQRKRIRRVLLAFLDRAVQNQLPEWSDDARNLLFRLIEVVVRDSVDATVAARRLIEYLDGSGNNETKLRALRALVGLRFQLSEGFWRAQYRGPDFGPIVVEALGKEGLGSAFSFLLAVDWTPAFRAALVVLVPSWIETFGRTNVLRALYCVEDRLDRNHRTAIRELLGLPENELRLFDNPARTRRPISTLQYELTA